MIQTAIESRIIGHSNYDKPYIIKRSRHDRPSISRDNRPYRALGGALDAWRSGDEECLLAGPAGTGKSRAILQKLHFCAQKYPGMRGLITRKTRHSISQTAMVTYEKKVLPEGWIDKYVHFNTTEQQYEYTNGSVIAVGGMDKPSKIMSSEWDMIYPQEACELLEEDWEALTTRLRNNVMPYQQLIADANPSYPNHWLKIRCDRKITRMILSKHSDNPSVTNAYLRRLQNLHGVMKDRLYYGKWVAAEGLVYDEFNPAVHIATRKRLIEWGILNEDGTVNKNKIKRFIAGVDWGYTNPGVINIFGIDNDDRMYLLREIYRTQKRIDWWVSQAKELHQEFGIDHWICDPSEPSYINDFRASGLRATGAVNDINPGIESAKKFLEVRGDGTAGFYVYEFALKERDELLDARHLPVCFENEINAYAWPKQKDGQPVKEVPVKINDHSCLVAGTLVTTEHGDVPIEQIKIGDRVLTRGGYKLVKAAGMTERNAEVFTVRFSNGATLTGTANHPVYLKEKGYTDLHALQYGDIIVDINSYKERYPLLCQSLQQSQSSLSSKGLRSDVIRTLKVPRHETITQLMQATDAMASRGYTKRSGRMLTALSQKDMTSTTRMETHLTMRLKTLNVSQSPSTLLTISQLKLRSEKQQKESISRAYVRLQLLGTDQKKDARGMEELRERRGRTRNPSHVHAKIVGRNSRHLPLGRRNITAPIIVNQMHGANQVSTISQHLVSSAVKSSYTINTKNRSTAQKNAIKYLTIKAWYQNRECVQYVRHLSQLKKAASRSTAREHAQVVVVSSINKSDVTQDVYNLTVDNAVGEGEYFANGILVHNCDVWRYVCKHLDRPRATTSYKSPWR